MLHLMKIRYYKNIIQCLDFEILHILSTLKIKLYNVARSESVTN